MIETAVASRMLKKSVVTENWSVMTAPWSSAGIASQV